MVEWRTLDYRAGQEVVCHIIAQESGGYRVTVGSEGADGFLSTQAGMRLGEDVEATFICYDESRSRILLTWRGRRPEREMELLPRDGLLLGPVPFEQGQEVVCTIVKPEPGGYTIKVDDSHIPGFLPTRAILAPGDKVDGQFVCLHNRRLLVAGRINESIPLHAIEFMLENRQQQE
jgi:ribosomal protein S1